MSTNQPTTIFTQSWSLYDLITAYNYMFHQEIYEGVQKLLGLRQDVTRYRLMDLGCGNARFMAPCLLKYPPSYYEGVDLSETALAEAKTYLAPLTCPVKLTHNDLLTSIESTQDQWDIIFSGFAVHHLTLEDKTRFFNAVGRSLSKQGWLILVDVVREEHQDRETYLNHYLQFMRETWTKVPPEQLEEACTHVHDHDYPETFSTLQNMAIAAGLHTQRIISRYGQHYTLLFSPVNLPKI